MVFLHSVRAMIFLPAYRSEEGANLLLIACSTSLGLPFTDWKSREGGSMAEDDVRILPKSRLRSAD